jgi:hypothetical protein
MSADTNYPDELDSVTPAEATDNFSSATVRRRGENSWATKAILKIQEVLGINPHGGYDDVAARLAAMDLTELGEAATISGFADAASDSADAAAVSAAAAAASAGLTVVTHTNAITASATQTQSGATALTTNMNRITVVTTEGDAVKLPAAIAGMSVKVINANVTNGIGIFPASGDAINAIAADGVYALAATLSVYFDCAVTGTWNTH